ncbi:MAG: CarD family transcriptional regulator [Butyrivibrio sp.]|nr:CarD family transcriptional regulator [Butyrivibrio sp.]
MLNKGDYVVYGNHGLCVVTDMTVPAFLERGKEKLYYVMSPVTDKRGVLYVPVDGAEEKMRDVIDSVDAKDLMDEIEEIEEMEIPTGKKSEAAISDVVKRNLPEEMMSLVKSLHKIKATRAAEGKKFAAMDEKYLRIAEKLLYTEIAFSLESEYEAVVERVMEVLESLPLQTA